MKKNKNVVRVVRENSSIIPPGLAEMEFSDSFRIQHSLTSQDKSYSSLPSSLPWIDNLERFADEKDGSEMNGQMPESLTNYRNPFEIFHGRPNIPLQTYHG